MNPILIGQAEEIDLVQPQVREMLTAPGFYIGGDSNNPEMNVPLVSNKRLVLWTFTSRLARLLAPRSMPSCRHSSPSTTRALSAHR